MNQSDNKFHATTEPVIYEYQLQNTHASRMKISTKVFVIASLAQLNLPLNLPASAAASPCAASFTQAGEEAWRQEGGRQGDGVFRRFGVYRVTAVNFWGCSRGTAARI